MRCFHRTLELGYADDLDLMLQIGRSLFREASRARKQADVRDGQRVLRDGRSAGAGFGRRHRVHRLLAAPARRRRGGDRARCAARCNSTAITPKRAFISRTCSTTRARTRRRCTTSSAPNPRITGTSWGSGGSWSSSGRCIASGQRPRAQAVGGPLWPSSRGDLDDVDTMLMELDAPSGAEAAPAAEAARGQLELFGTLLSSLAEQRQGLGASDHRVRRQPSSAGSWDDIVRRMRDETGNPDRFRERVHGRGLETRLPPDRRPHSDERRGELHPRQRHSGAAPNRSVTHGGAA